MTGQIARDTRSSSMSTAKIQQAQTMPSTATKAIALSLWTCEATVDRRNAPSRAAIGVTMKRRWGSRHDFTPPPATMHTAPSPRSTRYSHGHARNGTGVSHLDAVTVVEGPSPVIMNNSPARKNQSPATVTMGGGLS
jgi:hypothetical protein